MAASDEALHALAQHLVGETDGEPPDVQLGPNGLYLVSGTGGGPTVVGGPEPPQISLAEAQAQLPQAQAPVPRATDAFAKAATIGASRVGERYAAPSLAEILAMPNPLIGIAEYLVGAGRPRSVAAADPSGIEAWTKGAGAPPVMMGTIDTVPDGVAATLGDLAHKGGDSVREALATIKAYHGSPHDFAAFDANKIGTGEGAQVYGHGLYFAENPSVAASYKKAGVVDPRDAISNAINGAVHITGPDNVSVPVMRDWLVREGFPQEQITPEITDLAVKAARGQEPGGTVTPAALQALRQMNRVLGELPKGHMYETAINAHPDQFLDWDKPLSQQHPDVQAAVQRAREKAMGSVQSVRLRDGSYGVTRINADGSGNIIPGISEASPEAAITALKKEADVGSGQWVYDSLSRTIRRPGAFPELSIPDKAAAAQALREQGIPGIKYLDQGSRAAGEGTRNYVVFPGNEHLIDILKKYGLFVPAGGLAALEAKRQAEQAGGHGSVTQ